MHVFQIFQKAICASAADFADKEAGLLILHVKDG